MTKHTMRSLLREWADREGGTLAQKFALLHNKQFDNPDDATALCDALDHERANELDLEKDALFLGPHVRPAWVEIARMFDRAHTIEVQGILQRNGLPRLRHRLALALSDQAHWTSDGEEPRSKPRLLNGRAEHFVFLLGIFAKFRDDEDAALAVQLAKRRRFEDANNWGEVFEQFLDGHPRQKLVLDALRHPLPDKQVGLAYLDFANTILREGSKAQHPFDTEAGIAHLKRLLALTPDSPGVSAAAAIPFLQPPASLELLTLASKSDDYHVRMEGACAGARCGITAAIEQLKEWLADPRMYRLAKFYLEDLGIAVSDTQVRDPNFAAGVEMTSWLAHPREYGQIPDSLELIDTRHLYWPPSKRVRQLWLFRYRYNARQQFDATEAVGLVGTITFSYNDAHPGMTSRELYALYCVREQHWLSESDQTVSYGLAQLRQFNPEF